MAMTAVQTKRLLATQIQKNRKRLLDWQEAIARDNPPPFYCSIDLRDSGHKIVPVDSNLYPAGFNNICPDDMRTAPQVLRLRLAKMWPDQIPQKVIIIPEAHTQNAYYWENIHYLTQILREAGLETRVGWYGPLPEGMLSPFVLKSATDKSVEIHELKIEGGILSASGFVPDFVLLNNDFSSGYPELLDAVRQPIVPSHALGWHSRKKSEHFLYYNRLAAEFATIAEFDPWLIQIDTEEVRPVNFNEDEGIEEVAQSVERIIARSKEAYQTHGVEQEPFVFVKNNAGTYGMGIMVVHSGDELRQMNRRTKNKMSVGKNKLPIGSVAVQEGVPTSTLVDRLAAEPVIYLMGDELIGGFLRTNSQKGIEDNLNSQGMVFRKLCMSDLKRPTLDRGDDADTDEAPDSDEPDMELVYGSVARISALATGMELKAHPPLSVPARAAQG